MLVGTVVSLSLMERVCLCWDAIGNQADARLSAFRVRAPEALAHIVTPADGGLKAGGWGCVLHSMEGTLPDVLSTSHCAWNETFGALPRCLSEGLWPRTFAVPYRALRSIGWALAHSAGSRPIASSAKPNASPKLFDAVPPWRSPHSAQGCFSAATCIVETRRQIRPFYNYTCSGQLMITHDY